MKHGLPAFLLLLFAAGCGKVGEPRPPAIRIPAKVADLKAAQNQYQIILSWTNPSKYIDGSKATDLSNVRILRGGTSIDTVKVSGAGKLQTRTVDVSVAAVGTIQTYSISVETDRGKPSEVSNEISVAIVDVPGVVSDLKGEMDQHRIQLTWEPPSRNSGFADVYIVHRGDAAVADRIVAVNHFEDASVDPGKTYSYTVTAARSGAPPIPGPPSPAIFVPAVDMKVPGTPTGLQPPRVSATGAVLEWDPNTETDLAGYWIYRSDNPTTGFTRVNSVIHTSPSFLDDGYRPGMYYEVSAEDADRNESLKSASVRAP